MIRHSSAEPPHAIVNRTRVAAVVAAALTLGVVSGHAQDRQPRAQRLDMQAIADALGVECTYCHAPKAVTATGKLRLEVAREMIAMTADANARVAAATATGDGTRVSCVTCHRGVPVPRQLRDMILETAVQQGPEAAVSQYRDLRARYFGGQAYDFSETTLLAVAERLAQGRPAAAIAIADLNLEFHPRSWRSYLTKGIAQSRRLETTPDALGSFRKALEIDPGNGVVEGWIFQTEPLARRARPQ